MCGLAGLIAPARGLGVASATAMIDRLIHRGPDDEGVWSDDEAGIALGHRRLSIIDLSPAGHQPMQSSDGRWIVAYNGEIYNHLQLRRELEQAGNAPAWRGHSDTETLLATIAAWGPGRALERAHGMFALALWDRAERKLFLARDRFGEKPLYCGKVGTAFAFASELKALRILPGFTGDIDPTSLRAMLGRGYVPTERSIYRGIGQVRPGTLIEVSRDGAITRSTAYYDYSAVVSAGRRDPIKTTDEAIEALEAVLGKAVSQQLAADVPVGTLLSGGIDSSLITALATRHATERVHTYSIGFAEGGYDEAPHARAVAAHLGTDHHELYVTSTDALAVVPRLAAIWDEPFGDSSQIPTFLVSQFARRDVKVVLTGDAGDELFGGYRRHIALPQLFGRLDRVPGMLRHGLLSAGAAVSPAVWNALARIGSGQRRAPFLGHKVRRSLRVAAGADNFETMTGHFLDEWYGWRSPVRECAAPLELPFPVDPGLDNTERIMLVDALSYLPGDILTKVDRAAMAVSLEGRVPFLDPQVAALAARIPTAMKIRNGTGKTVLRELLYRHVPRGLVERPKAGFAVPIAEWLRTSLRDWSEDLLAPESLARSGFIEPEPIRDRWAAHLSGREDASQALWSVLAFQAWLKDT